MRFRFRLAACAMAAGGLAVTVGPARLASAATGPVPSATHSSLSAAALRHLLSLYAGHRRIAPVDIAPAAPASALVARAPDRSGGSGI